MWGVGCGEGYRFLKVPSIVCEGCAATITNAIQQEQPSAQVDVNLANKIVTVETTIAEAKLKQVIEATGHTVG